MRPTPSEVHVNRPLTSISIAYMQDESGFVADRAFPIIPSDHKSDSYFRYDRSFWLRNDMSKRAPGAESEGSDYGVDTDTFTTEVYALHKDISDQTRANEDSPLSGDLDATEFLAGKALLKKETLFAASFLTTGAWTTDITGVASAPGGGQVLQWNDASSNPIEDVRTGKRTVKGTTGFSPNKLVLGKAVYDTLCDHPDILDRIKYGQTAGAPAMVNANVLAQLFEVDEVLVMESIQNTAVEGATASYSFIGGKKALLLYTPKRAGLRVPSAGYTFAWNQYTGASENGVQVSRFRMEPRKSDRVEIEAAFVQKKVAAELGYFWNTIVA